MSGMNGWARALLLVSLAGSVRASTVVLTNADAFGTTSFNAVQNWSDGFAPFAGNDYLVTNGFTLRTPPTSGDQPFAGDSLTLGDELTGGTLTYKGTGTNTDVITVGNLTLNRGFVGNGQGGNFFLAGSITLGNGGGFFDYGGAARTITVQAAISGPGALFVTNAATGAGTVILASDNTYAGPTTIATGTLQVGVGGAAGTLGGGAVTNRGTLVFNRSDSLLVTNAISGETGALFVRDGSVTLLDNGVTNLMLTVADPAGAVGAVALNLSNATVRVLGNALGNCNVGAVANPSASGTVNMNGGSLTTANELWIAAGTANSRGYFNLYAGNVLVSNWTAIGRGSVNNTTGNYGELNVYGGSWSNVAQNNISIASFVNNEGRVNIAGGRLYAQNTIYVGESGTGRLSVAAGGMLDAGFLSIGDRNTGAGTVIVSGGVAYARSGISVANAAATAGSLYLSAGELRANALGRVGTNHLVWLSGGAIGPYNGDMNATAAIFLGADPVNGGAGVVTADVQTVTGGNAKMIVSGAIVGDGTLVKTGPGELLIGSACTYAGGTTVQRGYLAGTGSVVNTVTVKDGGLIGPASLTQVGTFTVAGDVTLEAGAGVGAFLNGATPSLIVGGTLTCTATNPLKLLALPGGVATGTYTLVSYGTLSGFAFTTGSLPPGVQGYVQDNPSAKTIEFVVTSPSDSLRWTGASNGTWDVETSTNWTLALGGTPATYQNGLPTLFDDTGTNTAITLAAPVTPDGIVVSNTTAAYSFGGASIDGPSGLTKYGAADLVISNANAYTGTNRILGGTVRAGSATALGSAAGPTLVDGGTLDVNGQNLGQERIEIAGAGVGGEGAIVNKGTAQNNALQYVTLTANATIGGSNRWDIRAGTAPHLNLNGYTLTKTGSNYIALVGAAATNGGDINVSLGTLAAHLGSTLGGTGMLTIGANGIFAPGTFGAAASVTKPVTINGGILRLESGGGAALTMPAAVTLSASVTNIIDAPDQLFTLSGTVTGPGGFTKTGANTLVLGGTNDYAGVTLVSAGQLHLGAATIEGGTFGGGLVSNNATIVFNRPDSHTVTNNINGSGALIARRGTTTVQNAWVTNTSLTVLDVSGATNGAVLNLSGTRLWLNNTAITQCQIGGMPNTPGATGVVNMSSGLLRSGSEIWIAAGTNLSRGVFNLSGGDVSVASWTAVGRGQGANQAAYGELNISGGTWSNITANNVTLGSFANNTGRLSVTAGRLYAQNNLYVAEGGVAYASVGGTGDVDVNILNVAVNAGGRGRVDVSGGTLRARNAIILGNAATTIGVLYQTGGALSSAGGDSKLANSATAYGYLGQLGGSFVVGNNYQIGATNIGIHEVAGTASFTANAGYPVIGRYANGRGLARVTGGSFAHNVATTFLIVGEQGQGTLAVGGTGTVTVHAARTADGLRLAHNLGTGLVTLATGGTIVAPAVSRGSGTNAAFVFNGGTLRANANNAAFLQNLTSVQVHPGGATIDDGGLALTIAQALNPPASASLASIPVVTPGSGYPAPPYVQIAGGNYAAAAAEIDPVSGALTNIVVLSPGDGFTGLPAVTLAGPTPATAATLGTPVLATNAGGGFTKLGTGTVTLTGASAYTGPTLVRAGTLALSGAGSFNASTTIVVDAGATVSVTALVSPVLGIGPGRLLAGAGTVAGSVFNDGSVSPGGPTTAVLTVTGSYAQTNGTLNIELGGTSPGSGHDQLLVGGAITFGGTLKVTLVNGYTGTAGDVFAVVSATGGGSGAFAVTNLPALGAGRGWDVQMLGGSVLLTITSAPTASGYDLYAGQIPNPADRGYAADPDGDGFANLLEYATGGNPTNSDTVARMSGARTNGTLTLVFNRSTNAVDTTLHVEGSYAATNDSDWATVALYSNALWSGAGSVSENGGPNPVQVSVQDSVTAATNRFLRLRVTRP